MLCGDIAEGQSRPKRDAGARTIAAHHTRHVAADGIKSFDGSVSIHRTGMRVRLDPAQVLRSPITSLIA